MAISKIKKILIFICIFIVILITSATIFLIWLSGELSEQSRLINEAFTPGTELYEARQEMRKAVDEWIRQQKMGEQHLESGKDEK